MKNILVVDDNYLMRKIAISLISEASLPVTIFEASDGVEALKIFSETRIDLIVTDVQMDVMDGTDLIKHVRESGSTVPIFVIASDRNDLLQSKELGADKTYQKGTGDVFQKFPADLNEILKS